jgi:CYTH domain-containing protein
MALEIERKFLVKDDVFKSAAVKIIPIEQGYITNGAGCTVRVRIFGTTAVLTIKSNNATNGIARHEWEYAIPLDDAREMMTLCTSNVISKTRYVIPVGKHFFEVDVFHDDNDGLVIAEVELSAEDEPFESPEWLGKEVTGEQCYYNAFIADNPYKKWGEMTDH